MKKYLLLLSIFMLAVSCKSDNENEPDGLYEERGPVDERTKMDFNADDNTVIITYEDTTTREFGFAVGEETITLTPVNTGTYPAQNLFYFYKDADNFFIGNIYDTETADMEFGRPDEDDGE